MRKLIDRVDARILSGLEHRRDKNENPAVTARDAVVADVIGVVCLAFAIWAGLIAFDCAAAILNGRGTAGENAFPLIVAVLGVAGYGPAGGVSLRLGSHLMRAAVASGDRLRTPEL